MMQTVLLIFAMIQGITLSGTIWQGTDKPAANAVVTAVGSQGTFQATSDKDGKFTFHLPKADTVELRARLGTSQSQPTTIFIGQDTDGVGILLPERGGKPLVGSLKVEGGGPLPTPRPIVVVHYVSGNVANRCGVTDFGLFLCPHPSEFTMSLEGVPESYFVKSIQLVGNRCEISTHIGEILCKDEAGSSASVSLERLAQSNFVKSIPLADGDLVRTPINVSADVSTSMIITLGIRK